MLPANNKSFLFTKSHNDLEFNIINPIHGINHLGWKYQHLYILSDEKINKYDWMINTNIEYGCKGLPVQAANSDLVNAGGCYKIIATTNIFKISFDFSLLINVTKSLADLLPSISQSFIDHYVSEYNKENKIEEVMVEYVEMAISGIVPVIKDDNTINIKLIKDSWNREEVIHLILKYESDMEYFGRDHYYNIEVGTNKWIETNL